MQTIMVPSLPKPLTHKHYSLKRPSSLFKQCRKGNESHICCLGPKQ